ncbi:NUDIX domain-containing protein [Candidatus Daviesbacteria bacterium]|nr:NUDIX domain-containing protein [Candidatus Daviesbacteria bacterium]
MSPKLPRVNVDILVKKGNKVLLGFLTKEWLYQNTQVYGVPGRDLKFNESIGEAVKRNIKEEIGCKVINYKIISVNANYEFNNHYIGIGLIANIKGKIKLLKPKDWEKWQWVDIKKIPQNLFPATKNLIRCFLENKFNISE